MPIQGFRGSDVHPLRVTRVGSSPSRDIASISLVCPLGERYFVTCSGARWPSRFPAPLPTALKVSSPLLACDAQRRWPPRFPAALQAHPFAEVLPLWETGRRLFQLLSFDGPFRPPANEPSRPSRAGSSQGPRAGHRPRDIGRRTPSTDEGVS